MNKKFGSACVIATVLCAAACYYACNNRTPAVTGPEVVYQPSPFLDFSRDESEEWLRNLEFELSQIKIQQHLSRASQPDLHIPPPPPPYSAWRAPLGRNSQCLRFKDGQWIVVND